MRLRQQGFVVYVAANMAVCALIFAPWALPRETVSGLLGRWQVTETGWKRAFGRVVGALADWVYWWEPCHCIEVYRLEQAARRLLYPC